MKKRVSGNQIWRHHFPALFITIVRTGSFLHCPFIKPCRNFLYDPVQVKCAGDFLTGEGETLILFGDTPLITADTLKRLKDYHREKGNTVTVLSAMVDDPTGYGRIIRDENGNFIKSVEHKDANEAELASHEINSGMYIFDTKELRQALDLLTTDNAQGEYYLPDTLTIIKDKGLKADAFALENAEDITGVNDQQQLAEAAEIIEKRKQKHS